MNEKNSRGLWWAVLAVMAFCLLAGAARAAYVQPLVDRAKVPLNGTWKFTKSSTLTGAGVTNYDDSAWETVTCEMHGAVRAAGRPTPAGAKALS